jgi:VanZ family protein
MTASWDGAVALICAGLIGFDRLQYNFHMTKLKPILWQWGPAILMMAAIFAFSSIPSTEMPTFGLMDIIVKKGGHALGYGLLALAYLRGIKGESGHIVTRKIFIAWVLATLYSATDEYHQSFIPGRHPAVTDVMIDSVGAALALILTNKYHANKSDQPGEPVADN